jgi:hypothetical protein
LLPNVRDILKPYGALDDTREVLDIMERQGVPANKMLEIAKAMYTFNLLLGFAQSVIITGMICLTCLHLLK